MFEPEHRYRPASEPLLEHGAAGERNLPIVESSLEARVFEEAVGLYRTARLKGLTVRSSTDCLVAACALRHDLEVLHRDRDYAALARVSRLRQRRV